MITALDEAVRNLQTELVKKSMWEDTLLVFMSDNGGKFQEAPNYPLRGGKGGVFEGGVRVASFVSGGFLPEAMRGRTLDGLIHICDWWVTFAGLAGISDAKNPGFLDPRSEDNAAIPHGVKRIDSLDMWPYLSGEVQHSPRHVVHLSFNPDKNNKGALIVGRWKLVVGSFGSFFPEPTSPDPKAKRNVSKLLQKDCGSGGCLFDLKVDEGETNELQ
jgi:arylsulfatase I/J